MAGSAAAGNVAKYMKQIQPSVQKVLARKFDLFQGGPPIDVTPPHLLGAKWYISKVTTMLCQTSGFFHVKYSVTAGTAPGVPDDASFMAVGLPYNEEVKPEDMKFL